jgi:hypothetical protein
MTKPGTTPMISSEKARAARRMNPAKIRMCRIPAPG